MTHTCTKVTVRQRAIRNDKISLYLDYIRPFAILKP